MKAQMNHAQQGAVGPYARLSIMFGLSFLSMFGLMYAMVDRLDNVQLNLNQVYMAGLMAAPMVVFELALMWHMYPKRSVNIALVAVSIMAMGLCWVGIRQQIGISDRQFLASMIPHHAGAILMCGQAPLRDPEVLALCTSIKASQQREIDFMKAKLRKQ